MAVIPFLVGPTGSGKTAVTSLLVGGGAVKIVNADRGLMIRDFNIGTAKPKLTLNYFLLDIISPTEMYSAFKFRRTVESLVTTFLKKGELPILSGGSMFYFNILNQKFPNIIIANQDAKILRLEHWLPNIRKDWCSIEITSQKCFHKKKTSHLVNMFLRLGISAFNQTIISPHNFIPFILETSDYNKLEKRVTSRFDGMLSDGLIEEVCHLLNKYHFTFLSDAVKLIGYWQCLKYVSGFLGFTEMRKEAILLTIQLIKRQRAWIQNFSRHQTIFHSDFPPNFLS